MYEGVVRTIVNKRVSWMTDRLKIKFSRNYLITGTWKLCRLFYHGDMINFERIVQNSILKGTRRGKRWWKCGHLLQNLQGNSLFSEFQLFVCIYIFYSISYFIFVSNFKYFIIFSILFLYYHSFFIQIFSWQF